MELSHKCQHVTATTTPNSLRQDFSLRVIDSYAMIPPSTVR